MRLTSDDHARVSAAVTQAERATDGEIVTVVARQSDKYHDVAAHWAVIAILLALTLLAVFPAAAEHLHRLVAGPWAEGPTPRALFTLALILSALAFLLVRLVLAAPALRLALTPPSTKARRVHARALALFRAAAEQRTKARTGVLLYLSLAERRAEIIADEAIHSRVAPEVWGAAMAALIAAVRDGRSGEGMAAAVEQIGSVLAQHFPRSEGDTNELPDRLIEL